MVKKESCPGNLILKILPLVLLPKMYFKGLYVSAVFLLVKTMPSRKMWTLDLLSEPNETFSDFMLPCEICSNAVKS